ncbi:MAG: DUF3256 family protein [Dysgonamonadaceae bacterium]|jgi:hypothetical protein|nr:DUF3256 family protein [Dysgonamonadaceae bacterium]
MSKIGLAFAFMALSVPAFGQTAEAVFLSLPEPLLPSITEEKRAEMAELFKSGLNSEVENSFGDSCAVLNLTGDYLKIRNGKGILELLVLTMANDSKIICLISTDCAPVCDSYIEFYSITWKKLKNELFFIPADEKSFLKTEIPPDDSKAHNALIPLDIPLMQFSYNPESGQLLQYYNTPKYLSDGDRRKAEPYLKTEPIVFQWNTARFEQI